MQLSLSKPLISTKHPQIRKLLQGWIDVCGKYQEVTKDDNPWNYHERVHTGFLAAAAWLAGGVALEEWRTEKKATNGKSWNGRGDLWLQIRDLRLHAEAKHEWVNLQKRPASAFRKTEQKFRKARLDASSIARATKGELRVGVLFAVPVVKNKKKEIAGAESRYREWIGHIQNKLPCLALAAIFARPRTLPKTRHVALGVVLLVGHCQR